jgi:hypothetical protein
MIRRLVWCACGLLTTGFADSAAAAPCPLPAPGESAIAVAAASLDARSYCEIVSNLSAEELEAAAGGMAVQWTDSAAWDPTAQQIHWVGREAGCRNPMRPFIHMVFDAGSGLWSLALAPPVTPCGHGYDHSTFDSNSGMFVHRTFSDAQVRRWDGSTWLADLPPAPSGASPAIGLAYFPELALPDQPQGALVWAEYDRVQVLPHAAEQWVTLPLPADGWIGGIHNFAEHNPVHHTVLLGGGEGSRTLYRLSARGELTRLTDTPVDLGTNGSYGAFVSVDPVEGDFVVHAFSPQASSAWTFDAVSDSWIALDVGVLPPLTLASFQVPLVEHGVIAFYEWTAQTLFVYRHSEAAPDPTDSSSASDSAESSSSGPPDGSGSSTGAGATADTSTNGTSVSAEASGTAMSASEAESSSGGAAAVQGTNGCACQHSPGPRSGASTLLVALLLGGCATRRRGSRSNHRTVPGTPMPLARMYTPCCEPTNAG